MFAPFAAGRNELARPRSMTSPVAGPGKQSASTRRHGMTAAPAERSSLHTAWRSPFLRLARNAVRDQPLHFLRRVAEFGEHFARVLAYPGQIEPRTEAAAVHFDRQHRHLGLRAVHQRDV